MPPTQLDALKPLYPPDGTNDVPGQGGFYVWGFVPPNVNVTGAVLTWDPAHCDPTNPGAGCTASNSRSATPLTNPPVAVGPPTPTLYAFEFSTVPQGTPVKLAVNGTMSGNPVTSGAITIQCTVVAMRPPVYKKGCLGRLLGS